MPRFDVGGKMGLFLINIAKYAVDSTIRDALKVVTGRKQMQKIVKQGLKDQPHSSSLYDGKPEDLNLMIEIQANMEKSKGNIYGMTQCHNISVMTAKGLKISKEIPNEGINGSDLPKNDQKEKIFIRSRL